MDSLSDVLNSIRFQGAIYALTECTAPWGFSLPEVETHASFFMIMRGSCLIKFKGLKKPISLAGGELILSPRGVGCTLQDAPDSKVVPIEELSKGPPPPGEVFKIGGGSALTSMVMGCFTLNAHQKNPFIASLPGTIHLTAENLQAEPGLESTIRLLTLELSRSGPGSDILVSRLTDAVFIQAIRAYISQIKKCPESPGWLKALTDPEIGTALNLMHEKPEAPWTVASLASEVNMSRTSFATKFTALVTETPIDYLTSWRMQKAIRAMQEGTESVAEIGEKVGYTSRASFAKAFKREFGHSPGEYKKQLETSAG